MSDSKMIDINKIDFDNIQLVKVGRGFKLSYNKQPLQFLTSTLYTPFGVKSIDNKWSNFSEYSIDCSINAAQTESAQTFNTFLSKLDEVINEKLKSNLHLFGNTNETDLIYSPILKQNKTYPKLMKLNLTRDKNGNFTSFVFDEEKNKVKIDESNIEEILPKRKIFKCIIECNKVWVYNGRMGSSWNIVQLKLSENSKPFDNDININIDDSGNNNIIYSNLLIDD